VPKTIHTRQYGAFIRCLKAARVGAGVTQVALAARLKMTQSAVSKIEMGEQRLDIIQLREWCEALGIKLSDFVDIFEHSMLEKKRSASR
jgi:transcriptional regulator with XRE-family HTH domain